MDNRIALCVDVPTRQNPQALGLDGESFEGQDWLGIFVNGESARHHVGPDGSWEEAWVVSSEDIDPINLAATLKADNPDLPVFLVAEPNNGSLLSRAHTAHIDDVIGQAALARRYADAKRRLTGTPSRKEETAVVDALALPVSDEREIPVALEQDKPRLEIALARLANPSALETPRGHGFVMPIVSGSGGAGKSTVSTLAAFIAQEAGYRTLLLDYDLQFGDVARLSGVEQALSIDEALRQPDLLAREAATGSALTVLSAPPRLEQAEQVVKGIDQILEWGASTFDVVIANTGAAWAEQHAALLERSHVTLFLIDQRASSIHACKHALELCVRCGIATGPFEFALNRCGKGAVLTANDVSSALQGAAVYELREGGRDVEDYLGAGSASDLLLSGNDLCESLRSLMARLLPDAACAVGTGTKPESRGLMRRRGRHASRKRGRKG